jgi:predicted Zn finger-like uncharacterized protein
MILTCPECSTKYVVKDGAIPEGGRQVRCASCKHSWHQDPEPGDDRREEGQLETASEEAPLLPEEAPGAEPVPFTDPDESVITQPEPISTTESAAGDDGRWEAVETGPESSEQGAKEAVDFEPYFTEETPERPRRAWPLVLTALLLAALAAVAFWFLAPAEMKARIGIADRGGTPLQVMGLSQDRQRLASGNDLFTVSGRIVNPTDQSQRVPPLQAELLADNKQTVIYRWTIAPPADTLPPNDSKVFHSAEMGVPDGGKYLRLRLVSVGG